MVFADGTISYHTQTTNSKNMGENDTVTWFCMLDYSLYLKTWSQIQMMTAV